MEISLIPRRSTGSILLSGDIVGLASAQPNRVGTEGP